MPRRLERRLTSAFTGGRPITERAYSRVRNPITARPVQHIARRAGRTCRSMSYRMVAAQRGRRCAWEEREDGAWGPAPDVTATAHVRCSFAQSLARSHPKITS
jgi:hypothetical protein